MLVGAAGMAVSREQPAGEQARAPDWFPTAFYQQAHEQGRPVYRIEPSESQVVVYVYPAGLLSAFGHDHVVSSRQVRGLAVEGTAQAPGRADLYLQVQDLEVDRPELRREAGFSAGEFSEKDIDAIREHMLTRVLDAQHHPVVAARLDVPKGATAMLEIRLHGRTQAFDVPVEISRPNGDLRATGQMRILQSRFGIEPFNALGGTLKVKDELEIRFEVRAHPVSVAPTPGS